MRRRKAASSVHILGVLASILLFLLFPSLFSSCKVDLLGEIDKAIAEAHVVLHPEFSLYYKDSLGELQPLTSGDTLDFGDVAEGNQDTFHFTIRNQGEGDLELGASRVTLSSQGDFTLSGSQPDSPIYPGTDETFSIVFTPSGTGGKIVQLRIESNDDDEGLFSFTLTGNGITNPSPGVPGGLSVTDGTDSSCAYLSWDGVVGAINYVIYRSEDSIPPDSSSTSTSMTYYRDEDATPGVPYTYWVKAYIPDADPPLGDYSDPDTGYRKLSAPVFTQGSGASDGSSTGYVHLTFDSVTGADSYEITRNTSESVSGADIFSSPTNSWEDTGAVPGRPYHYCLRAYSASSDSYSDYTVWDSGYRSFEAPASITASDNQALASITITWDTVSGDVDGYVIHRNTVDDSSGNTLYAVSESPYVDDEAYCGRIYYYWVKAVNNAEGIDGPLSQDDTGYAKLPVPPDVRIASGGWGSTLSLVDISWDYGVELLYPYPYYFLLHDGFIVYRSSSSTGPWTNISGILDDYACDNYDYFHEDYGNLHYHDTSAPPGEWFYYRVRTTTTTGDRLSEPTEVLQAYRPLPPPENVHATNDDPEKIVVTWDAVDGAVRYKIARTWGGYNGYTEFGETTALSYTDTSAESGKYYTYWVTPIQDVEPAHEGETGYFHGGEIAE